MIWLSWMETVVEGEARSMGVVLKTMSSPNLL